MCYIRMYVHTYMPEYGSQRQWHVSSSITPYVVGVIIIIIIY